jgi:glycosyltransferase involved in cell wall biosynthesis
MIIALNLLYLIPGVVGGTETYAISLIHALAKADTENDYVVFVNKGGADLEVTPGPNFRRVRLPVIALRRIVRILGTGGLSVSASKENPDIVHSLGYVAPLAAAVARLSQSRISINRSSGTQYGGGPAGSPLFRRAGGEARRSRHHDL